MERRELYQDDLTEERQPSPAHRGDVADTANTGDDSIDDVSEDEEAEDELND